MLFSSLKTLAVALLAGSSVVAAFPSSHSSKHSKSASSSKKHHAAAASSIHLAPFMISGKSIPDKYIVVMKRSVDETQISAHLLWLTETLAVSNAFRIGDSEMMEKTFSVGKSLRGYSGRFSPQTIAVLRANPMVSHIEQDQVVSVDYIKTGAELVAQKDAPWGLSRISHKVNPATPDGQSEYIHRADVGEGVTAYVIDTGVFVNHVDFEGRAKWGATIPTNDQDVDGNGHGTHVAGTIAGKRFGVAKKAKIVAVKVLRSNGSGTLSDVIKGVEWVVEDHNAKLSKSNKVKSVANMSLGGGSSPALDKAVDAAVEAGIHFAVAAGNSGDDACDYSPAASEQAVSVGATTSTDNMAYFSNHGRCTDIYGPGYNVLSTWIGNINATATLSGTSMASPHTAGVLAALTSFEDFEAYSPSDLKTHLVETLAHKDVVKGIPTWAGGNNRLLFFEENDVEGGDEEVIEKLVIQ
ncbi:serine protease [Phlyctochytrium planicorne]|nr:serine protease [Phlyctochytrium planicorne]